MAVASTIGLTACGTDSDNNIQNVEPAERLQPALVKVVFNPSVGDISYPNDLLFTGTKDGTLNFPDSVIDDPTDFSDPLVAANTLDGWSTSQPFKLSFDTSAGIMLDPDSVMSGSAITVFEAVMGASQTDADCAVVPAGMGCKAGAALVFGVDYVAKASGSELTIIPLKPLKAKTTYIIALTSQLKDTLARSVSGSDAYRLVSIDVNESPLLDPAQFGLQNVVNSYENLAEQVGVPKDEIIYTMAMTTQSIDDSLQVTKQLLAASLSPETALFTTPMVEVQDTGMSVADILVAQNAIDPMDPVMMGLYSSANYLMGTVDIPNYLGVPSAENPLAPTNTPWKALCDSGVILLGETALPVEPQSQSDGVCMKFGLRDLGLDVERNLTKYNPIPAMTEMQTVDVQVTTPDLMYVNGVRAQMGMEDISEPAAGWPVVMLQHGITSRKEDMLALTGILSVNGFATAAIDHPLHNSRGYDLNMDDVNDIDARTNPFAYLNISSLLNARDNLRQSTADLMAFRLGLNFTQGASIDASQVHFVGHSLGAITGANFLALTNQENVGAADGYFAVQAGSLAMPGGGIANFLFESGSFELLIKANLAYASSPEFKAYADAMLGDAAADPLQLAGIWPDFVAGLNDEQLASVNGVFSLYTFAAQTITDSGDPINYASSLQSTGTPLHIIEVVGDGMNNLSDQVIPNMVTTHPISGSTPLINALGLEKISQTTMVEEGTVSGAVKFVKGHHGSILDPGVRPEAPDVVETSLATQEMQAEVATYFATGARAIIVNDETVVLQ